MNWLHPFVKQIIMDPWVSSPSPYSPFLYQVSEKDRQERANKIHNENRKHLMTLLLCANAHGIDFPMELRSMLWDALCLPRVWRMPEAYRQESEFLRNTIQELVFSHDNHWTQKLGTTDQPFDGLHIDWTKMEQ